MSVRKPAYTLKGWKDVDAQTFAVYITRMRERGGFTLRGMAGQLGISPSYYSDLEKGRRNPTVQMLDRFACLTALSVQERRQLMELAGDARGELAPDVAAYVLTRPYVRAALRRAMETQAGEREWLRVVRMLEECGETDGGR